MEKKIEDKIKDLKKGDTVVLYNIFDNRTRPFEIPLMDIQSPAYPDMKL